ncbi:MAG: hypothetical protein RMA76_30180 [Deltaproteobacteria bacterium]|jgi:hypothetical protein
MTLPNTALFETFLASCTVTKERPNGPSERLRDGAFDASGTLQLPTLYLAYPDGPLKLESVLARLSKSLGVAGVDGDRSIALAVLALATETRRSEGSVVDHVNELLSRSLDASFTMWAVLPARAAPGYRVRMGPTELRPFDPQKLRYWANKIGCAYPFELSELAGMMCVARDRLETRILDWSADAAALRRLYAKWGESFATMTLLDDYYHTVFEYFLRQLPEQIREAIMVIEAGGMLHVDETELLTHLMTRTLGLFQWQADGKTRGWAVATRRGRITSSHPAPEVWAEVRAWLREQFELEGDLPTTRLADSVRAYTSFLQRAQRHRWGGRPQEGFLHFVIALDLLLGLEGQSTQSVSARTATLVHRAFGRTLGEQKVILKRLYNSRSKYVHEGRLPPEGEDDEVEAICVEVLWALLAASRAGEVEDVHDWIRQIDFVTSALDAGRTPSDDDLSRIGISLERRVRPSRVENLSYDPFAVLPRAD